MSNGQVHDRVTWYIFIPFGGLCWAVSHEIKLALICALGFLFGGLMFGPDLDTKSVQYKRWGWLRFLWIPYQKMGGHRSFVTQSHDSLLGVVWRVLYLAIILAILLGGALLACHFIFPLDTSRLLEGLLAEVSDYSTELCTGLGVFLLGIWIGNLSHLLTDWLDAVWRLLFAKRS